MKEVAVLLNALVKEGIIERYAVFGAIAQMRYTEAVSTMDADILVGLHDDSRLDLLAPIYDFCRARGYTAEGEAILVGDWPVQFIPVFDDLTRHALTETETGDIDGEPLEVVSAVFLALIALKTGRPKDYARVLTLLEAEAVSRDLMAEQAAKHGLASAWTRFISRFLDE